LYEGEFEEMDVPKDARGAYPTTPTYTEVTSGIEIDNNRLNDI
jgi:hypothetical protein